MEILKRGPHPPAVASTLNGDYLVDGSNWVKVSTGISYEDAILYYESIFPPKLSRITRPLDIPERQWEIQSSSNPDITYTVRLWQFGSWFCDCIGFSYRKTCRHVDECKKLIGN